MKHYCTGFAASLLTLFFPIKQHAQITQTLDSAYLKVAYTYEHTKKPPRPRPSTDQLILVVGKNISEFYSPLTFELDTLQSSSQGKELFFKRFSESFDKGIILSRKYSRYIFKNYPQGAATVTDKINLDSYIYKDTFNDQAWSIEDSIKTVMDYECQKAVCEYRGRKWTAWFTTDIPVDNGPWLLGGLPGLILEAYDSEKLYFFTATGLEKVTGSPIDIIVNPDMRGYIKTTRKEFLKGREQYIKHPMAHVEAQFGIKIGDDTPNQEQYEPIEFLEK
ncbi:GLPGLI family protein [Porphyromonas macacae]|uniref:GLPGLI family protein n=1 Tax=Porphyromonas macacae TaxID=28115 RepID=A0A379E7X0_9PORP|nr:GLPGLI family protein [Porphyromonas macacae]SUB88404.1 GLPGLI family protein [Porphyromonas macacae]